MSIFVSYSSKDISHVGALISEKDQLPFESETELWVAYQKKGFIKNIEPGSPFTKTILDAIEESSGAILFVSDSFINAQFITQVELPAIIDKKRKDKSYKIIPILVDKDFDIKNYPIISDMQLSNSPTTPLNELSGNKYRLTLRDALDQVVTTDKAKAKHKKGIKPKKIKNSKTSIIILILILIVWGYVFRLGSQLADEYEEEVVNTTVNQSEEELVNLNKSYFPDGNSQKFFQDTSPLKSINIFDNKWDPFQPFPLTIEVANYMSSEDNGIPVGDSRYDEKYTTNGILPSMVEFCPTEETYMSYPSLFLDKEYPAETIDYFRLSDLDANGRFEEISFYGPSWNGLPPGTYKLCSISIHFYNPQSPITPDLPNLYEYKTGKTIDGNQMHWLRVTYHKNYFYLFGSYDPDPYDDEFGLIMSSKYTNTNGDSDCQVIRTDYIKSCPTGTEYIWPHKFSSFFDIEINISRAITKNDRDLFNLEGFIERKSDLSIVFEEW